MSIVFKVFFKKNLARSDFFYKLPNFFTTQKNIPAFSSENDMRPKS